MRRRALLLAAAIGTLLAAWRCLVPPTGRQPTPVPPVMVGIKPGLPPGIAEEVARLLRS